MNCVYLVVAAGLILALSGCKPGSEGLSADWTHTITAETAYYTGGPQQARPPDGNLPAGTKVKVVEDAGSYVLIETESGVKAYVSTGDVKPIE